MHLLLALLAVASGSEPTQELTWDVTFRGKSVGHRTVTIKYVGESGSATARRILEGETHIDGSGAGLPVRFEQRFTATAAGRAPASFTSVVEENGDPRQVQGRLTGGQWTVSLVEGGRARTWEVPRGQIDLSTVDLFDPQSWVSLGKYDSASVLAAETGDIWEQSVERLGPGEVTIDGETIPVEGYAVDPPQGRAAFWYSGDGVLVRYEWRLIGMKVEAVLRDPPPPGLDEQPVPVSGTRDIGEVEL